MNGKWIRRPSGSLTTIFIHGILSDGDTCWRHSNGAYWPDLLKDEQQLESTGIYVFEYKTNFFSGTYRLGDVADALWDQTQFDGARATKQIVFVCHSMGGLIARRLLVQRQIDFVDANKEIGLFLIASPSLGSRYAEWLSPIARRFKHTQADALRFAQDNTWLMDLDRDFLNLKESGRLQLRGKELVEDEFIILSRFLRRQVVEPFSGERYFGEARKVANSNHFSIAKIPTRAATQHTLLVEFIGEFPGVLTQGMELQTGADNVSRLRFADPLTADLVACKVVVDRLVEQDIDIEVLWPTATDTYISQLRKLESEASAYHLETSIFHGQPPVEVVEFIGSARAALDYAEKVIAGVGAGVKRLIRRMLAYWTKTLDNIIVRSLVNFLTLCNYEIVRRVIYVFRYRVIYDICFPKQYEDWFLGDGATEGYRRLFNLDAEICFARVYELCGHSLSPEIYFWGPRSELIVSARRRDGDPIRGSWFDKYLIPQNELRLVLAGLDEEYRYDEQVRITKIIDSNSVEIA